MANFTAEKNSVWKMLMKMCQVMVNIIKLYTVRYRQLQCTKIALYINSLTVSTEILNSHLWSDDCSNEAEN